MQGKVKRSPRKRIRLSVAAEMIGCSTDTLIRWNKFQMTKLDPTKKTGPWMVYEAEVKAFLERAGV